jgi:hypothetical protein
VSPPGHFHAHGWSSDAQELVAVRWGTRSTGHDIVRWPLAKPDALQPVVETPAMEGGSGAALSPDGRWLAYASDQTGQHEIWIRPYPGPGAPSRISPSGGVEPVWARSGRELYYLEGNRLMMVAVSADDRRNFTPPKVLLDNDYFWGVQPPSYDVARDGRFLMIKNADTPVQRSTSPRIVVVHNWFEELKRLMPAR